MYLNTLPYGTLENCRTFIFRKKKRIIIMHPLVAPELQRTFLCQRTRASQNMCVSEWFWLAYFLKHRGQPPHCRHTGKSPFNYGLCCADGFVEIRVHRRILCSIYREVLWVFNGHLTLTPSLRHQCAMSLCVCVHARVSELCALRPSGTVAVRHHSTVSSRRMFTQHASLLLGVQNRRRHHHQHHQHSYQTLGTDIQIRFEKPHA